MSDCGEGIYRLQHSDHHDPINLGQDRMVTINELVDMVAEIADKTIKKRHDFSKPQGVRGRNADIPRGRPRSVTAQAPELRNAKLVSPHLIAPAISLMRSVLGWEPQVRLEDGLAHTYAWIKRQLAEGARHPAADEAKMIAAKWSR